MFVGARASPPVQFSPEPEADFNVDRHSYRLTVLGGRVEAPLLHCLYGFCIESFAERLADLHVVRFPIGSNNDSKDAPTLKFIAACLFRIRRIRCVDCSWRSNTVADLENVRKARRGIFVICCYLRLSTFVEFKTDSDNRLYFGRFRISEIRNVEPFPGCPYCRISELSLSAHNVNV